MHDPHESKEVDAGELRPLPSDLQSFEAALAQLRPSAARLDRDRLLFLAGQASVGANSDRRAMIAGWFWPATSAAMTGIAATLLFVLVSRTALPTDRQNIHPAANLAPAAGDEIAKIERGDDMPSAGAWTVLRQLRLADDLSTVDGLAQAGPELPEFLPAANDGDVLSARSFDVILRDLDEPTARSKSLYTPRSASPGTKS